MIRRSGILRIVLGLLLLTAAGLKLYGLSVSAVPPVGWFAQPWVQLAAAEWELVLGLWLISGAYPFGSWLASAFTFLAFAGVSGYLGWSGVASCGCFGAIPASPWWAFGVDVTAILVLAMIRPAYQKTDRSSSTDPAIARADLIGVPFGTAVLLVMLTGIGTMAYGSPMAALATLRGESVSVDEPYVDFGSGHPGDRLERRVTIRNWTNQPVRLFGGTSDCSCTVLGDLPQTIEPGCLTEITVVLRIPAIEIGRMTRKGMLRTDCPSQPMVVFGVGCRVD